MLAIIITLKKYHMERECLHFWLLCGPVGQLLLGPTCRRWYKPIPTAGELFFPSLYEKEKPNCMLVICAVGPHGNMSYLEMSTLNQKCIKLSKCNYFSFL